MSDGSVIWFFYWTTSAANTPSAPALGRSVQGKGLSLTSFKDLLLTTTYNYRKKPGTFSQQFSKSWTLQILLQFPESVIIVHNSHNHHNFLLHNKHFIWPIVPQPLEDLRRGNWTGNYVSLVSAECQLLTCSPRPSHVFIGGRID